MTILPKHLMSEEDIKLQYITPAITSKWNVKKISMEAKVTDGKINLKGNLVFREKPKQPLRPLSFGLLLADRRIRPRIL